MGALLPPQGAFHNAQMQQAGVELLSTPSPGSATGTVVVLTTPDADRTFMSYLGSSQPLELTSEAEEAISSTRLLIIEGYLWEMKVCGVVGLPYALRSSCGMSVQCRWTILAIAAALPVQYLQDPRNALLWASAYICSTLILPSAVCCH